jgi:hypothetical protein
VPAETPPQLPLYHLQVADVPSAPPFIDKVVLLPLQIVDEVAVAEVAGTDVSLTDMEIF